MKHLLSVMAIILALMCGAAETKAAAQAATEPISTTQLLDTIADAKGKVVLVNFFAAFCPPCRKEIPGLIKIRKDYSDADLVIIGISIDRDMQQMEEFIAKTGFNYPKFYGGEEVAYAFRVQNIPHNVIYDRTGKMVFNDAGYIPEKPLRDFLDSLIKEDQP